MRESTRSTIYSSPIIAIVATSFATVCGAHCPFAGKVGDTVIFEVSALLSRSAHRRRFIVFEASHAKDHYSAANGLPRTLV